MASRLLAARDMTYATYQVFREDRDRDADRARRRDRAPFFSLRFRDLYNGDQLSGSLKREEPTPPFSLRMRSS